ncbi:MAG TPA: hypothetical protein ENI08_02320 [Candidatus Dependentiae bacterium]|nr:hypothetical protein [Candidatus Dependentiae bacterium]
MSQNNSEFMYVLPNNFENTEIKLRPFSHTDLKNTLEDIVFKDKPEKDTNLLDKLFFDKSKTSKASVKALLNEIELRESLDSHLLDRINEDICGQHTLLEQLNIHKVHYIWE